MNIINDIRNVKRTEEKIYFKHQKNWQKQQNFKSDYWTMKCYKIDCKHTEWINSEFLSLRLTLTFDNDSVLLINLFEALII